MFLKYSEITLLNRMALGDRFIGRYEIISNATFFLIPMKIGHK